jgi:CRP/FNR family transcriptional regulator
VSASPASKTLDLGHLKRVCSTCSLGELCLPMGLERHDVERLEGIVATRGPLHEGDHLFRVDDPFKALYAVRSGYVKTYIIDDSGREQVLGFHLPGELVGLDAIYPNRHQCNAIVLDTASVCEMPYGEVARLAMEVPGLQQQMFRLMSKDIGGAFSQAGDHSAEEKLASFLLSLSSRLKARGYSSTHLLLAMPRRDIGNFLGLATETVSRVFTRFEKDGLIAVERREIRILDADRLRQAAHCSSGAR